MLFSSPEVADYINENFEPVWEAVRAVPTITIDFGNGKKIMRTVNGNIATYVCTKEGFVVDVLPGIYQKEVYIAGLQSIQKKFETLPSDQSGLEDSLIAYHKEPGVVVRIKRKDPGVLPTIREAGLSARASAELQKALDTDTVINEAERRPVIHEYLSRMGLTTPDQMKKWLYKEVLHADLDDPYLGLDRILSQNYPFDDGGS